MPPIERDTSTERIDRHGESSSRRGTDVLDAGGGGEAPSTCGRTDQPFRIQVAGERFWVPERAQFSIEHERDDDEEEIEFQLKWPIASAPEGDSDAEPVV